MYLTSLFLSSLSIAHAAKHHFFAGTYATPAIYGVEFDNVSNTLEVTKNNTTRVENEWLALSYDGKVLYSSGKSGWSSFNVVNSTALGPQSNTTPATGNCGNWNGVFVMASRKPPYPLYGTLTCANWISVDPDGNIGKATAVPYNDGALIYGMATDPTYSYLYSSDWKNGKIWTHRINNDGSLSSMGSTPAPSAVSNPRTLQVHPSGKALYVVLESWNAVALYRISETTHLPEFTGAVHPLVPAGINAGGYSSQSAVISAKGTILWATSHSRTSGQPGFMTAFSLSEVGGINEQLWQMKTPTSGGRSLNVAACPWSEKLVALTESEKGSVTVWQSEKGGAIQIANVGIGDGKGSCCSDVVWVD